MKKTLFLLLIIPALASAQVSIPMKTDNIENVFKFVDEMIVTTGKPYKLVEVDTPSYTSYKKGISFKLQDTIDIERIIHVVFQRDIEENNAPLEIDGKMYYRFTSLSGKYKDIFPIWKKYIDNDADLVKMASVPVMDRYFYYFMNEGDKVRKVSLSGSDTWAIRVDFTQARKANN